MKLPPKPTNPILAAWRKLPVPEDEPAITNLAGNFHAPMLLLADHPTDQELANNAPFTSDVAEQYMRGMSLCDQIDFRTDFLIVPFSRFGPKANKASTEHTFQFIKDILPLTKVKCVVVIGMNAFGFTFAGGRKTHARSIIGNPMYLPQIYTVPVFVMPDMQYILPHKDDWKAIRFAKEKLHSIGNLTLNLSKFVQALPPNAQLEKIRSQSRG